MIGVKENWIETRLLPVTRLLTSKNELTSTSLSFFICQKHMPLRGAGRITLENIYTSTPTHTYMSVCLSIYSTSPSLPIYITVSQGFKIASCYYFRTLFIKLWEISNVNICLKVNGGNSLAVQWLKLHVSTAGGPGSIPGQGTNILQAAWCHQKKKGKKKVNRNRNLDC